MKELYPFWVGIYDKVMEELCPFWAGINKKSNGKVIPPLVRYLFMTK